MWVLFPTLAVGLLDFQVHVVLALRPEPDYSAQPPVPTTKHPRSTPTTKCPCSAHRRVSLQRPTTKCPCNAQPQSVPAVPNHQVSLTTKYPCSAQAQNIPAVPSHHVYLQCLATKYPRSAQPTTRYPAVPNHQVPAVPSHQFSLQCPTTKYPCSA